MARFTPRSIHDLVGREASLEMIINMKQQIVVIKVGTNVITNDNGLLNEKIIKRLVAQICDLRKKGYSVILVSSGAMGAGRSLLSLSDKIGPVARRQVLAAAGQVELINTYSKYFTKFKYHAAQVLATKDDFRDRGHYLNMKNCFSALLAEGLIPIVNENDVVSVEELMFTDNDELSGLIAAMLNAGRLVILTNVDGVLDDKGQAIPFIHKHTTYKKYLQTEKSAFSRGGMIAKCRMAERLSRLGVTTDIVNGKTEDVILKVIKGEPAGTTFLPQKKASGVKKWIAHARGTEHGIITVNAGAAAALANRQKAVSILPVGVIKVEGEFKKGDIVKIKDEFGAELGFGRSEYDSADTARVIGKKDQKELVHYNYLFLNI